MCTRKQHGLSLLELIIFMVVMGVAATAVLLVMNQSASSSADPVRRKQALLIAEAYMEEIQLARFTYCDPSDSKAVTAASPADCSAGLQEQMGPAEGGNARPYDNVNDYAGAGASMADAASGNLLDASGARLGGASLNGFSATVTVAPPAAALGPAGALAISGTSTPDTMRILQITVRVTYGSGANDFVVLDGYRTRYAPNSIP